MTMTHLERAKALIPTLAARADLTEQRLRNLMSRVAGSQNGESA